MVVEKKFELLEKIEQRLRMTDDELVNIKGPTKDNVGIIKKDNSKLPTSNEVEARLRQID